MPYKRVSHFKGHPVHGTAGEWRYDHETNDVAVHVHRDPSRGDHWAVSVDVESTGRPGMVATGLSEGGAFREAYEWMRSYGRGTGSVPDARGEGSVGGAFDFSGGGQL